MDEDESEGSRYEESTTESDVATHSDVVNLKIPNATVGSKRSSPSKQNGLPVRPSKRRRQQHGKNAHLKQYLSKGYRDLLNSVIAEVTCSTNQSHEVLLPDSQIGASFWTLREKECLLAKLPSCGAGDLHTLSKVVKTKSEPEIRLYLQLLQAGVAEADGTFDHKKHFSLADVEAASEIQPEIEQSLDLAAEALAKHVEKHEGKLEHQRFGDDWLINESLAVELDRQYEASEGEPTAHKMKESFEEDRERGVPSSGSISRGTELCVPSAHFLNASVFLQLSRSLFMNSRTDPESNWHHLVDSDDGLDEPAMYRTAFDDFHHLTVSLTRRLVQTSIFQAMSRLRAKDGQNLKAAVNDNDVRAAVDVLEMRADWTRYWAKAPRRCGVEVYSDSKKYNDGRPGTKGGWKLSYDEAESALGLPASNKADIDGSISDDDAFTLDVDELEGDIDAFTTASCTDNEDSAQIGVASEDLSDKRSRKRVVSPESSQRAEDRYLDTLDLQSSRLEEERLCALIGLKHSESEKPLESLHLVPPDPSRSHTEPVTNWRDNVQYEAEWKRYSSPVLAEEFEEMEARGRRGRARRQLVRKAVLERLGQHSERAAREDDAGDRCSLSEASAIASVDGTDENNQGGIDDSADEIAGGDAS